MKHLGALNNAPHLRLHQLLRFRRIYYKAVPLQGCYVMFENCVASRVIGPEHQHFVDFIIRPCF